MSEFNIEKGVPIPLTKKRMAGSRTAILRKNLMKLEAGDSVVLDEEDFKAYYNAVRGIDGMRFFTSITETNERRIWRLI